MGEVLRAGRRCTSWPSRFIRINREAFQILLAKLRLAVTFSSRVAHVVAGGVAGDQGKAQRVGAVLVDDRPAGRCRCPGTCSSFGPARRAPGRGYSTVLNGRLAGVLQAGEDHAGNPEEDDVVAGDQRVGRDRSTPAPGSCPASPGWRTATARRRTRCPGCPRPGARACRRTSGRSSSAVVGDDDLAAVLAVAGRDAVAPPELAGDAPVAGCSPSSCSRSFQSARESARISPSRHHVDGGLCQGLHLHKPLRGDAAAPPWCGSAGRCPRCA